MSVPLGVVGMGLGIGVGGPTSLVGVGVGGDVGVTNDRSGLGVGVSYDRRFALSVWAPRESSLSGGVGSPKVGSLLVARAAIRLVGDPLDLVDVISFAVSLMFVGSCGESPGVDNSSRVGDPLE